MHASVTAVFVLSFLIGIVSGLRAMMAPAAVSWAARRGWLNLAPTSLAFGSDRPAAFIEDAVAIGGAFLIMVVLP